MSTWYLAIDFGTTSTCAATVSAAGTRMVQLGTDGHTRMPSGVLLRPEGSFAVGFDAERMAEVHADRYEPAPKRSVGQEKLLLGDRPVLVVTLVAAVLAAVLAEAREQQGGTPPTRICLTVPARWSEPRRSALLDAATRAGLGDVALVTEPQAAAYHYAAHTPVAEGDAVAVYDLGGGTFDTAVLRRTGDSFAFLGAPGGIDPFGGDDVDQRLVAALLDRPEAQWGAPPVLRPSTVLDQRAAHALRRDVRRAKEALTRHETTEVSLASVATPMTVSRADLAAVAGADVRATVDELARTSTAAGVRLEDLTAIFLAGSASRMTLVRDSLQERLGSSASRVVRTCDDPKLVCALGAAGYVRDLDNSTPVATTAPIRLGMPVRKPRTPLQLAGVGVVVLALAVYAGFQFHHRKVDKLHGTVRDSHGQPLADTRISITPGNSKNVVHVRTDSRGRYAAKLPAGSYQLEANAEIEYRKTRYEVVLSPHHQGDEVVDMPHSAGSALDWDLHVDGDDQSETVTFYDWHNDEGTNVLDLTQIQEQGDFMVELTFVPDGPLLDGTSGRTITRRVAISDLTGDGFYPRLSGIPLGTYTLSAALDGDGSSYPLVVGTSTEVVPSRPSMTLSLTEDLSTPFVLLGYAS